ncbi:hypothetical protein JHK86_023172 [Glycine max]|nr:hypothetical protein JHK86_023172 [Glycine max]
MGMGQSSGCSCSSNSSSCSRRRKDNNGLFYAVAHGKLKDVKAMVEEDPNVLKLTTDDDQKLSPLHVAAATGQVKTPLMYAAKQGKIDCVKKLIQAGANVFMIDSVHGGGCLHDAASHGHVDCLKAILFAAHFTAFEDSRGYLRFVDSRDFNGFAPLHLAALKGQSECVDALLDNDAILCARTSNCGGTALHLAARSGSLDCIRILLARGADRLQFDYHGNTPYTIALEHGHEECAALLGSTSGSSLVWPNHLRFIRELDKKTKALLEKALVELNKERQKAKNKPRSSRNLERNNNNIASMAGKKELCSICYDRVCTFVVRPCGHEMCAHCIMRLCQKKSDIDAPRSSNSKPVCPFCRGDIVRLLAKTK